MVMFFERLISSDRCRFALAALAFGLQGVEVPVLHLIQLHLRADVVLAGDLIDAARGGGVGDVEAGLRERARRPEVGERAATAVRDPQARVLAVPTGGADPDRR